MPSDTAQQLLRQLHQNYVSFFASHKKQITSARPPKYLKKNGFATVTFIPRQIKVFNGKTRLSLGKRGLNSIGTRFLYLKHIHLPGKLKLIRIIPHLDASYFDIDYVYDVDWIIQGLKQNLVSNSSLLTNQDSVLGIDLGLNNFATCVGTGTRTSVDTSETAFIVEGRGIKSQNRWYNKKLAKFQGQYDLHPSNRLFHKLAKLCKRHHDIMSNFVYSSVNFIIKYCL